MAPPILADGVGCRVVVVGAPAPSATCHPRRPCSPTCQGPCRGRGRCRRAHPRRAPTATARDAATASTCEVRSRAISRDLGDQTVEAHLGARRRGRVGHTGEVFEVVVLVKLLLEVTRGTHEVAGAADSQSLGDDAGRGRRDETRAPAPRGRRHDNTSLECAPAPHRRRIHPTTTTEPGEVIGEFVAERPDLHVRVRRVVSAPPLRRLR